jgi:prepilin-type N-terminal cleavage/methylation domain-containing protein
MMIRLRSLKKDDGFTLGELMITVFMLAIVMAIIFQSLYTYLTTSTNAQTRAFTLNSTRQAIERMAKSARAANPIDAYSVLGLPVTAYDNRISFTVYCSVPNSQPGPKNCSTSYARAAIYNYDSANYKILETLGGSTNTVIATSGYAGVPANQRPGAVVNTTSQPIFTYYDKNGAIIPTSGAGAPPSEKFRDCTKAVEIHLVVISQPRRADKTIDLTTRVELRNYHVVSGC